jgi:hypothetical protein
LLTRKRRKQRFTPSRNRRPAQLAYTKASTCPSRAELRCIERRHLPLSVAPNKRPIKHRPSVLARPLRTAALGGMGRVGDRMACNCKFRRQGNWQNRIGVRSEIVQQLGLPGLCVVRDFTLACASPALDRIDLAARLDRLRDDGEAGAVAGWACVFTDFRRELSHFSHLNLSRHPRWGATSPDYPKRDARHSGASSSVYITVTSEGR